ncbi:MAG: hypothetical protein ACP5TW_06500, partial [Thermoplasmata archaeon]
MDDEKFFYKLIELLYKEKKLEDSLYILEVSQPQNSSVKQYEDFSVVALYIDDTYLSLSKVL